MADIDKIAEELGKLTVLEAAELVKKLEDEWGVSAAAPVAAAAPAAGGGGGGEPEDRGAGVAAQHQMLGNLASPTKARNQGR